MMVAFSGAFISFNTICLSWLDKSFPSVTMTYVIVTLGKDLSSQDRQIVLKEMNAPENATIIEVTNDEEHKYLGDYIPKAL